MRKEIKQPTPAQGWRLTLSTRLVLGAIIVALIVVTATSTVSYIELRKLVLTVAKTTLSSQAKSLSNDLENHLSELADNVRVLAKNSLISNALVDDRGRNVYLKDFLAGFQEAHGFNLLLTMADFEGVPIAGNGVPLPNLAPAAWLSGIVEDEKGKAIIVTEGDHAYFIVAEPIIYTNTGTAEGVLVYQVQISEWLGMDRTRRILSENSLVAGLTLEISKADDTTIIARYGTEPEKAPTARVEFMIPKTALGQSMELKLTAKPEFIEHPLNQLLQTTGFSGLILLIFAASLAVFLVRTQISKLIRLRRETEHLTRPGSKNFLFTVEGNDEISDLANSFNGLLKDLHGAYQELEDRSFKKLQKSEERFSSLVQSQSDLIARFTTDGTITFVNEAYSAFIGGKSSNLIDRSIYQDIPKDEINGVKLMLAQLTSDQPNAKHESSMVNPNGEEKIIEWINLGLFDDHNVLTEVQSVGRDVTQQKLNAQKLIDSQQKLQSSMDEIIEGKERLEEEAKKQIVLLEDLAVSRDQAEAAAKSKSAFLASMSHEIRTPMTGVIGMAELMLDTDLSPQQLIWASNIKRSGDNLLTILNEILDQSKLEAGKLDISPVDFNLKSFVDDTTQLFLPKIVSKGLKFEFKLGEGLPVGVHADSLRISQIFSNYLSNALKFTETGTIDVQVDCEPQDDDNFMLRIGVTDSGIGLSEDAVSKLFSSFTQADSSTSRKFGGTGLGLSISKQLAELMGGEVGVDSTEGVGSTFWFTVPCQPAKGEVDVIEKRPSLDKWQASRTLKILLAEGNDVNQLLVKVILNNLTHEVTIAKNGKIATELTESGDFDLILMDIRMPIMDGIEATKAIRLSDTSDIPIIALTADISAGNAEDYMNAGMNAVCGKPLDLPLVLKTINKLLGEEIHTPLASTTSTRPDQQDVGEDATKTTE